MNKIIAPVDFSPVSVNAARYAANMAAALNKDLVLLHIIQLPVVYGDVPMPVGEYDVALEENKESLEKLAQELNTELNGQVNIHTEVKVGSPVYELIQHSKNKNVYAVVLGTHGAGAMERFFLGSTTVSLVREAECPVVVVPPDFSFKMPRKIGLASDFKNVVAHTPDKLIRQIVDDFGAKLEILHADPDYTEYEPVVMEEGLLLDTMFETHRPTFQFLHSGYTEESILNYAAQNGLDILIVMPKEHGILDSMFRHQHTGPFIRNATTPIMVIRCVHNAN